MRRIPNVLLALGLLPALAVPAAADVRSWTVCTPGALRSCHSIRVETIALMAGSLRVGTAVTVSLANLQGSGLPGTGTGTAAAGLYQLTFSGPLTGPVPTTVATLAATMTGPGASGALAWRAVTTTVTVGSGLAWLDLLGTAGGATGLLGGCTAGTTTIGPITARTCGPGARAVFAFSFSGTLDAGQLDNVFVAAYGPTGGENCNTNPSATPFFARPCEAIPDPLAPEVVPEPLTIVLLGTGLAAVGAARRRRRGDGDGGGAAGGSPAGA